MGNDGLLLLLGCSVPVGLFLAWVVLRKPRRKGQHERGNRKRSRWDILD